MSNRETIILFVFVLWIRITADFPSTATNPSSTENGPIAADMLPQLPLKPTVAFRTPTCAKV